VRTSPPDAASRLFGSSGAQGARHANAREPGPRPTDVERRAISRRGPATATDRKGRHASPFCGRFSPAHGATQRVQGAQVVGDDARVTRQRMETNCPGCRVRLAAIDASAHPYMTCSPACWRRYGDLLAAQYADPERMAFHQLVVDTYAVQHPDGDDPRAIQSVGIHLMTLCLFLERGVNPALGTRLHRGMLRRPVFQQLDPPSFRGELTMHVVPLDGDPGRARATAYSWAQDVWNAWSAHHQTVCEWVGESELA
jgi:hypothetical protein